MKHEKFIYDSYTIDENGFSFRFLMDEHEFRPRWDFPATLPNRNDPVLRELVFSLGMTELVSYWKCACPPTVEVRCGGLDDRQIEWWKKLYRNGLGEFFYVNKITPAADFMTIIAPKPEPVPPVLPELSGALIPVGGGKDSIVTLELLKENGENCPDNCCYIIGDIKRAYDSAKTAGYPDSRIIRVRRSIDPALPELNRRGYLNGHTPFSAIVAFSSLVFAYVLRKRYIVLSNESSADEGNVSGAEVNHQYSKSTEFERDFREYCAGLFPGLPEYFSLLRPWNELRITREFTRFPQYFPVFQSCNVGTKTNTWCCNCAKCLYVCVMLAAFLDDGELAGIFGENLLEKPEMAGLLESLACDKGDKPFECVGTRAEVATALRLARERRKPEETPLLLRTLPAGVAEAMPETGTNSGVNGVHFVPEKFLKIFQKTS